MIEGYSPWHTDENKRYCLMDTMDIVAVYRKVPDIVEGVSAVLEGRTLVIIPNVVAESAGVCKELSGKEWDDLKTLESDIKEGVRELGVPVEFAFTPDGVLNRRRRPGILTRTQTAPDCRLWTPYCFASPPAWQTSTS